MCAALGDLPRNEVLLLAHPDKAVWHGVGMVDKPPPVGWAGGLLALKARAGRVLTAGDGRALGLRWRTDGGVVDEVPSVRVDCEAGHVVVWCPSLAGRYTLVAANCGNASAAVVVVRPALRTNLAEPLTRESVTALLTCNASPRSAAPGRPSAPASKPGRASLHLSVSVPLAAVLADPAGVGRTEAKVWNGAQWQRVAVPMPSLRAFLSPGYSDAVAFGEYILQYRDPFNAASVQRLEPGVTEDGDGVPAVCVQHTASVTSVEYMVGKALRIVVQGVTRSDNREVAVDVKLPPLAGCRAALQGWLTAADGTRIKVVVNCTVTRTFKATGVKPGLANRESARLLAVAFGKRLDMNLNV